MRIIVNHVTRMKTDSRICVAGINPETFEHVRPTRPQTDPITRALLREEGGPFGMGAVVDLGKVVPEPSPPETEEQHEHDDDRERHWLQLNGLCLTDNPVGDTP